MFLFQIRLCAPLPNVVPTCTFHKAEAWGKSCVAGVGGVDSSYLALTLPSIADHNHKDYPAILVFLEYLCCLEVGKETVAVELVVAIETLVSHLHPSPRAPCGGRSVGWVCPTTTKFAARLRLATSSSSCIVQLKWSKPLRRPRRSWYSRLGRLQYSNLCRLA